MFGLLTLQNISVNLSPNETSLQGGDSEAHHGVFLQEAGLANPNRYPFIYYPYSHSKQGRSSLDPKCLTILLTTQIPPFWVPECSTAHKAISSPLLPFRHASDPVASCRASCALLPSSRLCSIPSKHVLICLSLPPSAPFISQRHNGSAQRAPGQG